MTAVQTLLMAALALAAEPGAGGGDGGKPDAAVAALATGKLVRRVVTAHDPEQSYALYLPSGYDPKRKWPILYCFSPYGRGSGNVPVELFQAAAEKYGWIVVGSNNSRNGPWQPIVKAVDAMVKDTAAKFSIDPARRYSTGFSGGARVAFYLACREKPQFAGVIPIGAGMARGQKRPGPLLAVYAICGERDVNHAELLQLSGRLAAWKVRRFRLSNFEGGHAWPPAGSCTEAVRYMELLRLQAMNKRGPQESESLERIIGEERAASEKLIESGGTLMRGHSRLRELAALAGDAPVAEAIRKRLAEIESGERFKTEKKAFDALRKVYADSHKVADANKRVVGQLAGRVAFIERHPKTEAAAREMVVMRALAASLATNVQAAMARKDYRSAEVFLRCLRLGAPREKDVAYGLACALARNGKKDEAIKALAAAVSLGFKDVKRIRSDPHLELLRADPTLQELLGLLEPRGQDRPAGKSGDSDGDAGQQ